MDCLLDAAHFNLCTAGLIWSCGVEIRGGRMDCIYDLVYLSGVRMSEKWNLGQTPESRFQDKSVCQCSGRSCVCSNFRSDQLFELQQLAGALATALFAGGLAAIGSMAALSAAAAVYKKRLRELEEDEE